MSADIEVIEHPSLAAKLAEVMGEVGWIPKKGRNTLERFASHIEESDGHWLWTGAENGLGYGRFWDGERLVYAHRFAYEAFIGPIPIGTELDHLCRIPRCCNPACLEAVPHKTNIRRGVGPLADKARQTHCKRGHEFTASNTYVWRGLRNCRACRTQLQRERRQAAAL